MKNPLGNTALTDMLPLTSPWIGLGSLALLAHQYQSVLMRVCYIALLTYWWLVGGTNYYLYNELLAELMRFTSKYSDRDRDILGRHYTLNIAEILTATLCIHLFCFVFPEYFWTCFAMSTFLVLFVFPSSVTQLWMKKVVTRISRWNRKTWQLRGLAIESACLSVIRHANTRTTRLIILVYWMMCYLFYLVSSKLLSLGTKMYVYSFVLRGFKSPPGFLARVVNILGTYCFWFHELGKFANPDPPIHKYTPFKNSEDIRVVLLYPRFAFSSICCSLIQGPNMQFTLFEAISYTWGDIDATEDILVDGCKRKVTKSVYEILATYSSMFIPKLLWIDALCIDQENDTEKSQQVQLMKRVYRSAFFVTVFLGRSPLPEERYHRVNSAMPFRYDGVYDDDEHSRLHFEDARLAFDLLNELEVLRNLVPHHNTYETYEKLSHSKLKSRKWHALVKMLRHPFFERVWVVQEVALAKRVQVRYGDEVIDWDVLASGMAKLHARSSFRAFSLWLEWSHGVQLRHVQHTSLFNIRRIHRFRLMVQDQRIRHLIDRKRGRDSSLHDLLSESFYFKATNPKDLIYGLMGICNAPLQVDYNASVKEVYMNAAKALHERSAIHLLIHAAGVESSLNTASTALDIPSWVPDWTNGPKYERLRDLASYGRLKEFKAGGEAELGSNIKEDGVLCLSGFSLDVIEELGPVIFSASHEAGEWTVDEMFHLATQYNDFQTQLSNSPSTNDPYPYATPSQSLHEALRRTIVLDRVWFHWDLSSQEFQRLVPKWEENLKSFLVETSETISARGDAVYQRLQRMDRVTEQVKSCCGGRRLFITRKGYIGLCPPNALIGDLIYIVPGLSVPIILKQVKGKEKSSYTNGGPAKSFKLVGECYVHGIMNGKAMSMGLQEEKMDII